MFDQSNRIAKIVGLACGALLLLSVDGCGATPTAQPTPTPAQPAPTPFVSADCSSPAAASVDWHGCNKDSADLRQADLTKANISHAVLGKADLTGANLDGAVLAGARYNYDTTWPAAFTPPPEAINVVE